MDEKYNLLTQKLLAEGYTAENYPDYVRIGGGSYVRKNPLDNTDGGFVYIRAYSNEITYKTGCGKFIKGRTTLDNMGTKGVIWCPENDNPVFRCPYDKPECEKNDSRLHGMYGGGLCIQCWCTCHRTKETYDYENSIEKANAEREEERKRKYQEYYNKHKGRICSNHMYYDECKKEWNMHYDPGDCARLRCVGQYERDFKDGKMKCPILGRTLDRKKGNVFYDLKIKFRRMDLDGTFFEGQIDTQIMKGKRAFKNNVSMDICNNYVKLCREELEHHVRMKYHRELFFSEHFGQYFEIEILNVRAEQRTSRDLMQDLQDIRDGIAVAYERDMEKAEKQRKHEVREKYKEKKIQKMEKQLIEVGYENIDRIEQDRACKMLGVERIEELDAIRQQKLKEEQMKPEQLSIFDILQNERKQI